MQPITPCLTICFTLELLKRHNFFPVLWDDAPRAFRRSWFIGFSLLPALCPIPASWHVNTGSHRLSSCQVASKPHPVNPPLPLGTFEYLPCLCEQHRTIPVTDSILCAFILSVFQDHLLKFLPSENNEKKIYVEIR